MRRLQVVVAILAGTLMTGSGGEGRMLEAQQQSQTAATESKTSPTALDSNRLAEQDKEQKQGTEEQKAEPPLSDRQKKLAADTDKLLALAKELKQQVDKTNKNVLSVSVVKKAEEIEKLARSVKGEMK